MSADGSDMPAGGARPLDDRALDQLFRTARSRNGWLEEALPDTTLRALYDLTKMGPTSANTSPARFVFVTSPEGKARLKPLLSEGNQKALAAPLIAIIGYDLDFTRHMPRLFPHNPEAASWFGELGSPKREGVAQQNAVLQGAYLLMAARALGLDVGPMAGFDRAGVDREFFAGGHVRTSFLTAIGRGADTPFARSPRLPFEDAVEMA